MLSHWYQTNVEIMQLVHATSEESGCTQGGCACRPHWDVCIFFFQLSCHSHEWYFLFRTSLVGRGGKYRDRGPLGANPGIYALLLSRSTCWLGQVPSSWPWGKQTWICVFDFRLVSFYASLICRIGISLHTYEGLWYDSILHGRLQI